uniref:Uncharacterized protein n=1 Tax=Candidatus Kentrum sp. LPFa TaxID=2126335 RepID=A0A450X9V3_9GAMM|nr:MAG: hypothetical protein BECKLPF1236A_GA0070988_100327 [Candidatus Kentron sp. LPFa]VFK26092.1 MAG: hypothetical protein BECKLPF1236C_GA0070990_100306 [Candidatus Kentron sp. LPFa]
MIFVSIAEDKREFVALRCGVDLFSVAQPRVGDWPTDPQPANLQHKELLIPPEAEKPESLLAAFADIAAEFSKWLKEDEVTILVSQVEPMALNPLLKTRDSLLAMLILAFPEARWFVGTIRGYGKSDGDDKRLDGFRARHDLSNLFQPQQTPLFDGAGLRDWVRERAKDAKGTDGTKKDTRYLPRREQLAIAMDEETDYANLHAYTAYRFGFRALAISGREAADAVLGRNPFPQWGTPDLVLEDLFLNFPSGGHGLSDLERVRGKEFPVLEQVSPPIQKPYPPIEEVFSPLEEESPLIDDAYPRNERKRHRILITSGQSTEHRAKNRKYIAERRIRLIYKPLAGIFSIWEKSGLDRRLRWLDEMEKETEHRWIPRVEKTRRGTGKGYVWPPDWREIERIEREEKREREKEGKEPSSSGGHSSPGILLLIARHLIGRAKSMLAKEPPSVEEAVRGAVLAGDALELLGGKTPTSAAEALSLKHRFELHAECQFVGVEHHIPLVRRFDEIKRDAASIARWFRPEEKERASLNIQMNIVNQLLVILRQYNQFDEEQVCMARVRRLQNSLYMQERQGWGWIFWPLMRYSEFLFKSFSRFTLAIFLWIGGLFGLFSLIFHMRDVPDKALQGSSCTQGFPFGDAISTFLGTVPITSYGYWAVALSVLAIVAGLAHLGIFISYLYTLVSRR